MLGKINTQGQQAEEQRQSEERFRSLIAATSQIVWTTNPEGRILEDSPSWRAYTGQTFEEYQEFGWSVVHPDDREKSVQQWNQAIVTKSLYEDEYRLQSAEGHYRHFWVRGVPILADDGSIREWIGTCTDIHDRRESEIALKRSEERFRSLMQASAQIIWNTNADGELVTEQPSWSTFTGQTFEEYKGWGWLSTIHPDDSARVASVWSEAVTSRSLYKVEFRMRRHDGEYRYMSCRAVPILQPDGAIREWIGANTDITEKKQAEATLQEQTNLLQLILHSMSDGIIVADEKGKFLVFNPAAQQMHGSNGADVCEGEWSQQYGLFLSDQVTPFPTEQLPLARAIRGEEAKDVEMFVRHAQATDGCWMLINGRPLRDESDQVKGGVIACRDISDRKRAEIALEQAKEAAEAANRAKSEFLANMSHELRTPLNGVIGYAQILQRAKTLNEEDRSRIEVIHQCGSHLLTLINDILDLSKIEARKTELLPTDFHLPAFLQGVAEMCRIRAELKGIQFCYESAPELPIGIRADEKRLRQVLINLLSNAIKFTDAGIVTFRVSFAGEGKIRFEVHDTGIGIPQEKLHAIFQPFEQVSDAKRQSEGTGLGLAISQEIVALMGSTIEVQSEIGVGSIFRFDVEFTQADEWVKTAQTDRHGQIIGIKNSQPRILVVDDKWENRSVIANLLSPIGFEVLEASNGNEGWQKIQEFYPHLIITDLLMPDLGGFELIKKIRETESLKDLIVIVSSASVFEADQYRSIEAGGNDFLPKPVLAVELFQKLQKHLKLEWIYEEQQPTLQPASDNANIVVPPAAELEVLYELAMKGNLKGITKQAASLEQIDEKYSPFAKKLQQLAKGFQDQEILTFIQSYR